jgi:endonuclease III related protein
MSRDAENDLNQAYILMRTHYGHLHWWPGETPFEVCVGAVLTQNTSWTNVERAIANLKAARVLNPRRLFALPEAELAELIHPSGYHNVKARRLRAFLSVLIEQFDGELSRLFAGATASVRQRLLAINGIGPETADCLLLYAGGHASFVIDAYTKRIFSRHHWCQESVAYEELKRRCEASLPRANAAELLDYWQDYHAQLVNIGKDYCRKRAPDCASCPLNVLPHAAGPLPA